MTYLYNETLVFSFISSKRGSKVKRTFKDEKILKVDILKIGILRELIIEVLNVWFK